MLCWKRTGSVGQSADPNQTFLRCSLVSVYTHSKHQRRINVAATSWRCSDVVTTLCVCWAVKLLRSIWSINWVTTIFLQIQKTTSWWYFFLFSQENRLTLSPNNLHKKFQSLFSGNNKKIITNCHLLNFLPKMLSVSKANRVNRTKGLVLIENNNKKCLFFCVFQPDTAILTFTMLWANSADDKLTMCLFYFFFYFFRKQDLALHASCLLRRQFAWSVKSYFPEKKKIKKENKNILKCRQLKFLLSMPSVNAYSVHRVE